MATKEDKMTPHGSQAIENIPEHIKKGSRGTEQAGLGDFVLPRIAIAQTNTPQAKKSDPLHIPGLIEGQLFNTVTNQIYGEEITVVPLFFFKQRIKFPKPYGSGQGIECQSLNGRDGGRLHPKGCETCPHSLFQAPDDTNKGDTRPACDTFFNFMCLLPDGKWVVLSLKSTMIKPARQFIAKVRMSGVDMFARTLKVSTIGQTRNKNSYYGVVLTPGAYVPKELFEAAEKAFNELKDRGVQVDTRGLGADDDEDTDFGPGQRGDM